MPTISQGLTRKLHPSRYPGMSPKMAALVGFLVEDQFTQPDIAEVQVTSDGYAMGRASDDCGCNQFLGNFGEVRDNFARLRDVAGLTPDESQEFNSQFARRFGLPLSQ